MLRVAITGAWARKVRLLLTSIAVVLGVGFVAGAFYLTDSLRSTFDDIFSQATQTVAVEVRTAQYRELAQRQATSPPGTVAIDLARVGVPPSVLERVRAIEGVARAEGTVFEVGAQPVGKDGVPIGGKGPPNFAAGWVANAEDFNPLKISRGSDPGPDEVMLDEGTRKAGDFKVGDRVQVLIQGGRSTETFRISGFVRFGTLDTLAGATITVFDTPTVQRLLDMGDRFSAVDVEAADSTSDIALKRRVDKALPPEYVAVTGEEYAAEQNEQIDSAFLDILQNVILGFAAIAVFVGAFTIFNTFTILVGQRTREFGLLRAIGASRTQILGIVAVEALVVGAVASTVGLAVGYGVAWLLRELINSVAQGSIPGGSFPLRSRTVAWSYGVGLAVTLLASVLPAWRAARLSPLEAIRAGSGPLGRGWRLPVLGIVLCVAGGSLMERGFALPGEASTSAVLSRIGGGVAVAIVGLALLSRVFIAPVTRVLGVLLAHGTSGRLAQRNVLRNRARSASTSSALMIGIALASLVLVFYGSLQGTVDAQIDASLKADLTVFNSGVQGGAVAFVGDRAIEEIQATQGVDIVVDQRLGGAMLGPSFDAADRNRTIEGVAGFAEGVLERRDIVLLDVVRGTVEPGDGVLVDTDFARDEGLEAGDELQLAFPTDRSARLRVEGIFEHNDLVGAQLIVSRETFDRFQPPQQRAAALAYVLVDAGADPGRVGDRIEDRLGRDAQFLEINDSEGLREEFRDQLRPILGLTLGMLGLSLVIAVFGIANTLALSVFERTREIGLLRAVGGTRRQLRRMIRVEAVLIALFGAVVGLAVGVAAGRAIIAALEDDGFVFTPSWPGLAAVLVVGLVAGLVASVLPARRAARTDVLGAINAN